MWPKNGFFFTKKGIEIILATKHNLFCFAWVFNYDCVSEQKMLRNELYWAIWNSKFPSLVSNSNLISTEGALGLPTTYDNHQIPSIHPSVTKPLNHQNRRQIDRSRPPMTYYDLFSIIKIFLPIDLKQSEDLRCLFDPVLHLS